MSPPRSRVPLRLRLPNAPPLFCGRRKELNLFKRGVGEALVTVVSGPGGIGKTAFVFHALHRAFPGRVGQTLYLGLRPGGSSDVRAEIVRALVEVQTSPKRRTEPVDWTSLLADPEALAALAIDLAEAGPWWVVLD